MSDYKDGEKMKKFCCGDDNTKAVITAKKHIESCRKSKRVKLPETALVFFMRGFCEYANENYDCSVIMQCLPTFLNSRPIYSMDKYGFCFLHGGWGAPMAADTVETLAQLGVKNIISIGMMGAFDGQLKCGDIVVPNKAFVFEGTSLSYYENIDFSCPDKILFNKALKNFGSLKALPIVSTDAVYRQTFGKEKMWRKMGAVGVDMETSALFSISNYLNVNAVSILIVSDEHPLSEAEADWKWKLSKKDRKAFFDKCIEFAKEV